MPNSTPTVSTGNLDYQAVLTTPFASLGVRHQDGKVFAIDFLPNQPQHLSDKDRLSHLLAEQLNAYSLDPDFRFQLPLLATGTDFQRRVWRDIAAIPRGQTRFYSELSTALTSSPRAVGQVCGANPLPIVVPCHRVIARGGIGGFNHHKDGQLIDIKRLLLRHETSA